MFNYIVMNTANHSKCSASSCVVAQSHSIFVRVEHHSHVGGISPVEIAMHCVTISGQTLHLRSPRNAMKNLQRSNP